MTPPDDLSKWSLHCFCLGARKTPQAIVRQANHGRVLFEIGSGRSLEELRRAGLTLMQESIQLLGEFRLLEQQGGRLRCTFPRFGPEAMLPLRARMAALAADLLDAEQALIQAIRQELAALGLSHSFYAVLFGEVMDGLLWHQLRARIEIPDTRPNAESPLWRGVFWAVYPPAPGAIGTNEITQGRAVMTLVWSDATSALLNQLRQEAWPREFMRYLLGETALQPVQALTAGLVDASGKVAVPVFGLPAFARLASLAEELAESTARQVAGQAEALAFSKGLTAAQRHVIVLHEYIWAMQSVFHGKARSLGWDAEVAPPKDARGSIILHIRCQD